MKLREFSVENSARTKLSFALLLRSPFYLRSATRSPARIAMTLPELLVVMGILGVLMSLIMPAVLQSREKARAVSCKNNLRQLALAAQNHHAAHDRFPFTQTSWAEVGRRHYAISPHRYLMAYLDPTIYDKIEFDDPTDPCWDPVPPGYFVSSQHRKLHGIRLDVISCPSDNVPAGGTSYRANMGISVQFGRPGASPFIDNRSQKGAFVHGRAVSAAEFRDGLAHTVLFSERVVGDYSPSTYDPFRDFFGGAYSLYDTEHFVQYCESAASADPENEYSFAGASWLIGGWLNTWYSHLLVPNSQIPDCGMGNGFVDGGNMIVSARSFHPGLVHVAMADGSVRSISDAIELDVWRAAGTRSGGESSHFD